MDDLDIVALFAIDDGEIDRNNEMLNIMHNAMHNAMHNDMHNALHNNMHNALHNVLPNICVTIDELMEPLPELDELRGRQRRRKPRNENYYENIVPQYDDILFKEHFRMSRATFEELVNVIGHRMPQGNQNYFADLRKKVMFSIWMLAKPASFLAAGDRFGLAKSTGYYIFQEIISVLAGLLPEYVRWSDRRTCCQEEIIFRKRSHGFPGIVGAIDGCHIPIKAPTGNPIDFYNRNKVHSIVLQAVCDHKGRFIDICIGMPGRMHDARIFRRSELFTQLTQQENLLLSADMHILGDSAYPLMINLMTSFRDNRHLTREQINYNMKLSSIRSIIERAFGLLKGKWRRLKYLDISEPALRNEIIVAACVIHNFLLDRNEINYENEAPIEDMMPVPNNENELDESPAMNKRNGIAQLLR